MMLWSGKKCNRRQDCDWKVEEIWVHILFLDFQISMSEDIDMGESKVTKILNHLKQELSGTRCTTV